MSAIAPRTGEPAVEPLNQAEEALMRISDVLFAWLNRRLYPWAQLGR